MLCYPSCRKLYEIDYKTHRTRIEPTALKNRPKKPPSSADLTRSYLSGELEEDENERAESFERFGDRSKNFQQGKTEKTQSDRPTADIDAMPTGEVIQVHSLFADVLIDGLLYSCVQRKTLAKISGTQIVVGDRVRVAISPELNDLAKQEGVIERIEPRRTILTRADSFKAVHQHPIVANADQMLIVAALHLPEVKWGLVDRMLVAAQAGGLVPILCLNKIDTAKDAQDMADADAILSHYESLSVSTVKTCATSDTGITTLRDRLTGKVTVLAGHSGVGKSCLIRAVDPTIDLRVGEISRIHSKGMHTTTSARNYRLTTGGHVVDTPGVKLFGLWNLNRESLVQYFPDVEAGTAPPWRKESYERIMASLVS